MFKWYLLTNGATTKKTIDKASEPLPIPEGFVSYYKHLKYCSEDRDYDCSRWVLFTKVAG